MKLTTNKDGICLELHGREQFWALRAKVNVLKDTIKDVRFEPKFRDWRRWEVRMPGTHAPKLLLAGSYWTEDGWDFLYVKRPIGWQSPTAENVLVIETTENRYSRIIVSVEEAEGRKVSDWWKKTKKTLKSQK